MAVLNAKLVLTFAIVDFWNSSSFFLFLSSSSCNISNLKASSSLVSFEKSSSSGTANATTSLNVFNEAASVSITILPVALSKNKFIFSAKVSKAPAKPPAAPSPDPPTCSLSAFKIISCAFAFSPVNAKTLIKSFCSLLKLTPTRLNADKPISGSSNALPNCNAAVFILPKPTSAKSWERLKASLKVSPVIDLKVNKTPAACLAPWTLARVFLATLSANISMSLDDNCAAPPVALIIACNFNELLSALFAALTNLPNATAATVNPATNATAPIFILPKIAPILFNLPATGPNGPCTAAIVPAKFLIDSCATLPLS